MQPPPIPQTRGCLQYQTMAARPPHQAFAKARQVFQWRDTEAQVLCTPRQGCVLLCNCRVVTCMRQWKAKMVEHGFQELVFEDAMEVIVDQLNALGTPDPLTIVSLESNMRDGMLSNMVIMYMRMLTSCEVQRRQDFFAPFIMGMMDDPVTVEQFCRRYVEPMGEESDHIHIVAITDALQIAIRVVYLDRSTAAFTGAASEDAAAVNHHDFVPEAKQKDTAAIVQPRVHLLYRPGHYDILYPTAA
ncbi:hypothetical protein ABBQ32_009152 [Trebouxia sp. C0010 RCD-2024]